MSSGPAPLEGARRSGAARESVAAANFIEAAVASAFRAPPEALRSASRGPARIAFARQVAMYLAHTRFGMSFARAGAAFRRDRTTAAHACRTVEERRDDPAVDALIERLELALDLWPDYRRISRGDAA